jgi:hypothetical protein
MSSSSARSKDIGQGAVRPCHNATLRKKGLYMVKQLSIAAIPITTWR